MNRSGTPLKIENLTTGYRVKRDVKTVCTDINLEAERGKLIFLTGQNGAGKTTLLKTITGDLKSLSGKITVRDNDISSFKRAELSRLVSVVFTAIPDPGYITVEEIVSLGRAPYTGIGNSLSKDDRIIIDKSVEMLLLGSIRRRLFSSLSDGEKQKTMIARAFCQDTEIICMDEPASHLDFPSRIELISRLKAISENEEKTIIVSSHDLDSAVNSGDIMWLIDKKGNVSAGAPEDLALSGKIGEVFNRGDFRFSESTGCFLSLKDYSKSISLKGDPLPFLWTEKGLRKTGIKVIPFQGTAPLPEEVQEIIVIEKKDNTYIWKIRDRNFSSIDEVLNFLKENFI